MIKTGLAWGVPSVASSVLVDSALWGRQALYPLPTPHPRASRVLSWELATWRQKKRSSALILGEELEGAAGVGRLATVSCLATVSYPGREVVGRGRAKPVTPPADEDAGGRQAAYGSPVALLSRPGGRCLFFSTWRVSSGVLASVAEPSLRSWSRFPTSVEGAVGVRYASVEGFALMASSGGETLHTSGERALERASTLPRRDCTPSRVGCRGTSRPGEPVCAALPAAQVSLGAFSNLERVGVGMSCSWGDGCEGGSSLKPKCCFSTPSTTAARSGGRWHGTGGCLACPKRSVLVPGVREGVSKRPCACLLVVWGDTRDPAISSRGNPAESVRRALRHGACLRF